MKKITYTAINLYDLVPKYIPQDVYVNFGDTGRVCFGDAHATLIDADQLQGILIDEFDVPFVVRDFELEFGDTTLINLEDPR